MTVDAPFIPMPTHGCQCIHCRPRVIGWNTPPDPAFDGVALWIDEHQRLSRAVQERMYPKSRGISNHLKYLEVRHMPVWGH